jgi:hypothetical protein
MDRKALVLTAAFCLVPTLALSDGRDDLIKALRYCAALTDAPSRLACYDRLAPQFAAPTPQAATAPPAPPSKQEKESWFGLDDLFGGGEEKPQATPQQFGEETVRKTPEQAEQAKQEEIDSITAHLANYALDPYGRFTVFLDNGQIWAQLQGDSDRARFPKNLKAVTVTIERAIFGSYSMSIAGNHTVFKVKRLK